MPDKPSAAGALEGILRTLRFTSLIFAGKKNLRTANLMFCHPQLQQRMVDPDGLEPPTRRL